MTDGTNTAHTPGLLPCPFCGGRADITTADEAGKNAYVVCCRRCQASSPVVFALKDSAAPRLTEAWNRRLPAAEMLKEIIAVVDAGQLEMNSPEIGGHDDIPLHPWHEEWLHRARTALDQTKATQ